jgi:glycosyltransferase involved in cell wall biosynthesis
MSKINPSITVTTITYQDETIIEGLLESIRNQTYNQKLIEILIVDGGSTDLTIKIAKRFGAKVICRPDLQKSPNLRGQIAVLTPTSDLVMSVSADNRFQELDLLERLIEPFSDETISGTCTLRYGFSETDPIASRYFALIGGVDPIAIGLGKADRGPHDTNAWHSFGEVKEHGDWLSVTFQGDASKVPTLGANGFIYRRRLLSKTKHVHYGTHADMCLDLIQQGYDKFAFIRRGHVIHLIDIGILPLLRRRLFWADKYDPAVVPRIYKVFQKRDLPRLILIFFSYTTFLVPTLRAIKGYWTVRDIAWFLHPIVCFVFTIGYSYHYMKKFIRRVFPANFSCGRKSGFTDY